VDFDGVADELYGLDPKEFTAVRAARAKEARARGERELAQRIAALRRPTVSAWLANQLVRQRPADTAALFELGKAMREAQQDLSGVELRRLSRQRSELVAHLAREAEALAVEVGLVASAATLEDVSRTLDAASLDQAASVAFRSGRLTAPLRYSGFGLDAPAAGQSSSARVGRRQSGDAKTDRSTASPGSTRAVERAVERAEREQAQATRALEVAETALDDVRQRIRVAEAALKALRAEDAEASCRVADARKERSAAQSALRAAEHRARRDGAALTRSAAGDDLVVERR
jgi:hypothetical protein